MRNAGGARKEYGLLKKYNVLILLGAPKKTVDNIGKGGKGGPGPSKTQEHIESIKRNHLRKSNPGAGRKPATDPTVLVELVQTHGKGKAAEILGISYDACKSRYCRLR